jgi:uncharacterized membrane protein YkvA (DUF1232 family)
MTWWLWLLLSLASLLLVLSLLGLLLNRFIRKASRESVARRIAALPNRRKLALGRALLRDRRVPLWAKGLLMGLVLYLMLPIDIVPDFIPVVGYVDDALLALFVLWILLKATPRAVLLEHLQSLE